MIFLRPASYLLVVAPHTVELWGRRRHQVTRLFALGPDAPDFKTTLKTSLERLRGHSVSIVLNLPDLILQHENLPHVPWLDRHKLLQSRRAFLSHPYGTAALFPLSAERALFAAQPQNALLKSILHVVGSIDCPIRSISHMALEALQLLPAYIRRQSGIAVMRLPDSILILAHHAGHIAACRNVPLDEISLPQEIRRTYLYLQRHGWSGHEPITMTGMGVTLPALSAVPINATNNQQDHVPYLEILAHHISHKPRFPLTSDYLHKKTRLRQIEEWLCNAALLALTGALVLWGSFFAERLHLGRQIADLHSSMESLPPPLPIKDRAAVIRLNQDHDLTLPLLATLSPVRTDIQSLQLNLPTVERPAGELRLTTTHQPQDRQDKIRSLLTGMPNWHLKTSTNDTESQSYILTVKAGGQ